MENPHPRPWFVELAIDAVESANRIVAAALNKVLAVRCQTLEIKTEPVRFSDSLEDSALKLKRALPELRRIWPELPERDSKIYLATVGYINTTSNDRIDVYVTGLLIPGEFERQLTVICDFLKNERIAWSEAQWQEYIVSPYYEVLTECLNRLRSLADQISPKDGLDSANCRFIWGGRVYEELTPNMIKVLSLLLKAFEASRDVTLNEMQNKVEADWDGGFYKVFEMRRDGKKVKHPVREVVTGRGRYELIDPANLTK